MLSELAQGTPLAVADGTRGTVYIVNVFLAVFVRGKGAGFRVSASRWSLQYGVQQREGGKVVGCQASDEFLGGPSSFRDGVWMNCRKSSYRTRRATPARTAISVDNRLHGWREQHK